MALLIYHKAEIGIHSYQDPSTYVHHESGSNRRACQMAFKKNKAIAVLAAIIGIIGVVIPIEFLSWWKADLSQLPNPVYSQYINAWAQYMSENPVNSDVNYDVLPDMYLLSGILTFLGAVVLFLGGVKGNKAVVVVGSIVMLAGPVMFIVAQTGNGDLSTIAVWLGGDNRYFGSKNAGPLYGDVVWYLNVGFFLPIAGGVIGFLSLRHKAAALDSIQGEISGLEASDQEASDQEVVDLKAFNLKAPNLKENDQPNIDEKTPNHQ